MPHGSISQYKEFNGNYKHGGTGTKLYEVWCAMRARCNNKANKRFNRYGGRGIYVCEEWDEFSKFREWALANDYQEGLSIDRIDNDGPYSPENCRWANSRVQNNNQCTTTRIKICDTEKTLNEWAEFSGIKPETLRYRISAGWEPTRAIFEKVTFNTEEHRRAALKAREQE